MHRPGFSISGQAVRFVNCWALVLGGDPERQSTAMPITRNLGFRVLERGVAGLDWLAERRGRQSLLAPQLRTGERGEDAARFYLRRNGFMVVAQR
jgi:hypothetical protein